MQARQQKIVVKTKIMTPAAIPWKKHLGKSIAEPRNVNIKFFPSRNIICSQQSQLQSENKSNTDHKIMEEHARKKDYIVKPVRWFST